MHIICHGPATNLVLAQFAAKFQGLTRLLDLPPFASFTPDEMTQLVLGNPTPPVLTKLKGWITEATPICGEFAHALRMHVTSLHPVSVDLSSDDHAAQSSDSNDDFSPILLPPGFQPASAPPQGNPFTLLDNRCWGSTYSSNGPHMVGVLARYLRGTATPNAQCVSR